MDYTVRNAGLKKLAKGEMIQAVINGRVRLERAEERVAEKGMKLGKRELRAKNC